VIFLNDFAQMVNSSCAESFDSSFSIESDEGSGEADYGTPRGTPADFVVLGIVGVACSYLILQFIFIVKVRNEKGMLSKQPHALIP
jgi:hypothetical protein